MQFQERLKNQTWENGKKPNLDLILANLAQIMAAKLFFAKSGSSVTRCHGQFSSCTTSEKTIDPIFRKLSDGRADGHTEGQTEGQTDGQEWFHTTLSD